ncbi:MULTISPECIES: hypothetical protein [unclassified Variovorax]|jgi:hypothetical protein|uniref:hypothetical protein n=1 Tax=unclassified Variovorax TaxID=663243 RepID=UPI0021BB911A|nr:hypothetical protein [Variovorax sp. CY25R-8]MCT8181062.1 hypothetical protein [Variovorax sp. CY25R-8]
MQPLPGMDALARRVMGICVDDFRLKPCETLSVSALCQVGVRSGMAEQNLMSGIGKAVMQGWLEVVGRDSLLRVTAAGYFATR